MPFHYHETYSKILFKTLHKQNEQYDKTILILATISAFKILSFLKKISPGVDWY